MPEPILVINAGSSSIKFSVFETAADRSLKAGVHGQVEGIGTSPRLKVADAQDRGVADQTVAGNDHRAAIAAIQDSFTDHVSDEAGFRGVHRARHRTPRRGHWDVTGNVDQTDKGSRRYGFHGLSYEDIISKLPEVAPQCADGKLVVAHLGNGASMCAIAQRRSIATTMGLTPVDGLPMGTRTGALDPGVILYLIAHERMDTNAVQHLIYEGSGLLGVSGLSSDMRTLLASNAPAAREAVALFVYRIGRELGSLVAALEGLDALVFTGGIGENAAEIRARVCRHAGWLGVALDEEANARGGPLISRRGSAVSVWGVPTQEKLMVAPHTLRVIAETARATNIPP